MQLSVIIPTYNRKEKLKACLQALSAQSYPASEYEVLIVDDGSSDGTESFASARGLMKPGQLRYFRQPQKGPAAARNAGVANARGRILLFLGDDIMASPGLLERHSAWHAANAGADAALLGYVTWAETLKVTPFMKWLENGGPQFGYGELTDGAEADPARFFYTCNISLKKEFVTGNGLFDEDFKWAAYEDLELGLRLKARGLKLYYDKKAAAWHDHRTTLSAACARMLKVGESAELFRVKTGGAEAGRPAPFYLKVLRALRFSVYFPLARVLEHTAVSGHVFKYVMWYYRRRGAETFWKNRSGKA